MNRKIALMLCAAAAAAMPFSSLALAQAEAQAQPTEQVKQLKVGDEAPDLLIGEWVKGESFDGFEDGKVYVVEFWATWCGPCIAGMPHLSDMQEKYKDRVTIIGVNIWDDPKNVEPFMKNKGGDKKMRYTVGIEQKIEGQDPARQGRMNDAWMKPAGRNGIPSAFVVDKQGKIAFIGHPMWLDIPVEGVLAGDWDAEKGAKKVAEAEAMLRAVGQASSPEEGLEAFKAFEDKYPAVAHQSMFTEYKFSMLLRAKKFAEAWRVAERMVADAIKLEDAMALNRVAWTIVDPAQDIGERDLPLALKAARAANDLTEEKNPAFVDTLARVYWEMGERSRAVELQRQAVEQAEGSMKAELEKTLAEYEEGMKTGG